MTPPPTPPLPPSPSPGYVPPADFPAPRPRPVALHVRRCARHAEREAVARCVACGGFFCRECIAEHDRRVYCASCLVRVVNRRTAVRGRRHGFAAVRRGMLLTISALLLWTGFWLLGRGLGKLPARMHEGTLWQRSDWEKRGEEGVEP